MGSSLSTGQLEIGSDENCERVAIVGAVVVPHLSSAQDVCRICCQYNLHTFHTQHTVHFFKLCRDIARVCKALHTAVNSNDYVWQQLCTSHASLGAKSESFSTKFTVNSKSPLPLCLLSYPSHLLFPLVLFTSTTPSTGDAPFPSATFVPPSKLPCHTWKQVYQQMIQYEHEMVSKQRGTNYFFVLQTRWYIYF
jgi:hypothetical protein